MDREINMLTVFEAAQTGNTEALKKLKIERTNLNKKDSSGNTPLLIASSCGHLETVKWLLQHGDAQITETNKSGNTALLLAAAYGHLDTVIWLLSKDSSAKISETNMLGSTPVLMAAYHGQISVVDYLIRYYYTESEFNPAEKQKLDFFTKNVAIRYYLDVFKLFSQETVDYMELTSLLDKASQCLKSHEISFIYLIFFWMQIKYKANPSSNFSEIMAKESCMQKLLPSQQGELISYMFQEGYVLDNCFINQDTLIITGINLDESQTKVIKQLLKQHENDSCLMSKNSITEKKQLYVDYYLNPVYSCLLQAYRSRLVPSDANAIEKLLVDPYTYHLDPYGYHLNSTKKLIAEVDIAKWTAYHLCQRSDTTTQQHRNAYTRTVGASRISYYETVQKYLDDDHVQKKPLLLQLGDISTSDGERLYWIKEYPNWLQSISQAFATQRPTQQRLRLIGLKHPIFLSDTFGQQLWNSTTHEPMPFTLPGNHPVYRLVLSEQQAIYCKLFPGLPGINDALHYLYRRVFSSVGGLPWSVAGLLEIDNQTIPVLFSEDAGRPINANGKYLNMLDPHTRSKLILFTILTNTEDGKRENYAIKQNARGFYDISSVDNDQGLVEATTESGSWFNKTKKLSVKSLLFCLNAMNEALDETAVQEFLTLKPMDTLTAWLKDLSQLEEQYDLLYKECKDSSAKENNLFRRSYLQVVLPVATLLNLAYKMQRLQKLLEDNPKTNPLNLLHDVEPVIAHYYQLVLQQDKPATKRFDILVRDGLLYKYCEKTKSYSTTITSSREIFESLVPDNQPAVVTAKLALEMFEKMVQQWELLKLEQIRVIQGEIDRLNQLPLKEQQNLLKLTRLNQFNSLKREMLLQAICNRKDFIELYLCYPQSSLTNSLLSTLLKNNTGLECLSITNAIALTSVPLLSILKSLKKLELIQLPVITEVSTTLPMLTELVIKADPQLTSLKLDAPLLHRLRIIDCPNLETFDLPKSLALDDVIIQGCDKLPLSSFYSNWPGFISRWREVPARFRQRLTDCVTQSFVEPTFVSKEAVYNTVMHYLDELIQLCQQLQIPSTNSFRIACVLAHLGYDHPFVIDILLKSLMTTLNRHTIEAVSALQLSEERVVQGFMKALEYDYDYDYDHTGSTHSAAAKALGALQVKDERIILGLVKRLRNVLDFKKSGNSYGQLQVAKDVIDALNALQVNKEHALKELRIDDSRINARIAFAYGLGVLQKKDMSVIPLLLSMLKDNVVEVRQTAAFSLGALQIKHEHVIQGLLEALIDECPGGHVAREAAAALKNLQVHDERVVLRLLKALTLKINSVRIGAIRAAGELQIQDERIILELLKALVDTHYQVRSAAANSLGSLHVKDERIILELLNALKPVNDDVCIGAALSLGNMQVRDERIILGLLDALATTTNNLLLEGIHIYLRKSAADSLGTLQVQDKRVILGLLNLLGNHGHVQPIDCCAAARALGALQVKNEHVIQGLLDALELDNETGSISDAAATALSVLQVKEKGVMQKLWMLLGKDEVIRDCPSLEYEPVTSPWMLLSKDEVIRGAVLKALVTLYQQPETALQSQFTKLISLQIKKQEESGLTDSATTLDYHSKNTKLPSSTENKEVDSGARWDEKETQNETKSDSPFTSVASSSDAPLSKEPVPKTVSANNKNGIFSLTKRINKVENDIPMENMDKKVPINLFSIAENGNLENLKKILSKNRSIKVKDKNKLGNTALSLAANKGHFPVVDYLIRYYYVESIFNKNEKKALDSLSKNNIFRYYLDVFTLFSKSPVDYKAIKLLLKEATKQLKGDDSSNVCLLYFWMQVHHRANTPFNNLESMTDEPSMHQLLPEHQSELILHMIRQGHALKNWYINSNGLAITEMTLDKKQVNALEQLLEQGEYEFCLRFKNSEIENNKIYLVLNDQGALHYTVRDPYGNVSTGLVSKETLGCELTAPFTLDQLHSLPDLLEQISKSGYFRPQFQTLILNNVRFTKEYQLRLIKDDHIFEKNMLYVQTQNDFIEYTVIAPSGKKVTDTISGDMLRKKGFEFPESSFTNINLFKPILSGILEITTERGHTVSKNSTKGYETFLTLLKNQTLMPQLQKLHLQDCDLFDDFDLSKLYPILAQRATLIDLNLDKNHITQKGLLNLLETLFKEESPQVKLQTLSVCLNKIEICSFPPLHLLASKKNRVQELIVTGNMIADDNPPPIKRNHKNRVAAMSMLLDVLSKKEPNITIDSFLTGKDVKLIRGNSDNYLLSITLANSQIIDVVLQRWEFDLYDMLRFNEKYHEMREEILPKRTPQDIFSALISGIGRTEIPEELSNTRISQSFFSTSKICKMVLNYHQDTRLKGQLKTHSLIRSQRTESQPSFLFPNEQLTLQKGFVYLIANNKGLGKEHSLLGFEYLTGYGQRIFKVAHLQFNEKDNTTYIKIEQQNLTTLISWVKKDRLIAKFQADTKKINFMHVDILDDAEYKDLPKAKYQRIIFGSSQKEELMNCLTYCLVKIKNHLNDIHIDMGMTDCRPSTVVSNCIKKQNIKEEDGLQMHDMRY